MSTCRSSSLISTSPVSLHDRRHLDAREARLAAVGRVERRQPHQPVHAALGAEQAVGVLAGGAEGGRLDARFLARARLQQLDLEAAALGPAHQHPQHHLRPVLRVGAAGARVDGHERVAGVVAPGEQPLLLERRQALLDRGDLLVDLAPAATRPRRPSRPGRRGPRRRPQRAEHLQAPRRARVLGRHRRRALGVVPEALGAPSRASSAATRSASPAGSKIVREQLHLLADRGQALRGGLARGARGHGSTLSAHAARPAARRR